MKILITGGGSGGHVSPALAVARQLRQDYPDISLLYVGGHMTMEGSTGPSIEEQLVVPTGIPFQSIHAGKLRRDKKLSFTTVQRLWGVVPGCFEAWQVVRMFKPDAVFSSGGYVSLPVVLAATLLRVPVIIHEQTAAIGLTNNLASRFATKVAVTFPQSAQYFPASKVVVTGNPLRSEIVHPDEHWLADTPLGRWVSHSGLPIIYITGGGLGSHIINQAVEQGLVELLSQYRVVHQCGAHAQFADYERLVEAARQLPEGLAKRYWPQQHFSPSDVGGLYSRVAAVVARAGANTVLEVAAHSIPTVFIPIPWVTHDEQTKNAQLLVAAGTAKILPEDQLSLPRLMDELKIITRPSFVTDQARQASTSLVQADATGQIIRLLLSVMH